MKTWVTNVTEQLSGSGSCTMTSLRLASMPTHTHTTVRLGMHFIVWTQPRQRVVTESDSNPSKPWHDFQILVRIRQSTQTTWVIKWWIVWSRWKGSTERRNNTRAQRGWADHCLHLLITRDRLCMHDCLLNVSRQLTSREGEIVRLLIKWRCCGSLGPI